jgi:hypothetical protein
MKKLLAVAICLLIGVWASCGKVEDEYAMINFMIGDVKKNDKPVEMGELIKENDRIVTAGQSSCDVKIGNSIIRVKENSNLVFAQILREGGMETTTLGLDVGKMLCKPKKLMKDESFMVKTPTAVAGVRGTKFSVEADEKKNSLFKVFDGKIQVIKRVPQLESQTAKLLESAPAIEEKEKVVITQKEVNEAEKKVEQILKKEDAKNIEVAVVKIAQEMKNDVVMTKKDVTMFKAEDFRENAEVAAMAVKPKEIIKQIAQVVKLEKEKPKPDGRLLVTRYEIYFIKNGKVIWEGKVVNQPIKQDNRLYIASGDYIYCASVEGPVLWRKNIVNDGKIEMKDNKVLVYSNGVPKSLDPETGQE